MKCKIITGAAGLLAPTTSTPSRAALAISFTVLLGWATFAPASASAQTPTLSPANSAFECRARQTVPGRPGFSGLTVIDTRTERSDDGSHTVTRYNPTPLRVFGFPVTEAVFDATVDVDAVGGDRRVYYEHSYVSMVQGDYTTVLRAVGRMAQHSCRETGHVCRVFFGDGRSLLIHKQTSGLKLTCSVRNPD